MTPAEFQQLIKSKQRELSQYISRKLPIKVGAKVRSIVQENFRLGGFQDGNLQKWQLTKRQLRGGKGADAQRGPLLSSRKMLYNSTKYRTEPGKVTIYNDVTYAGIHNEGGTLRPRVTPKMRKYAWKRYYEAGGGKNSKGTETGEASFWKGLALTKKKNLNIKIPKRQFIGPSQTINTAVQTIIENDLNNILNS